MDSQIADLRQNYTLAGLSEADVDSDPIKQFGVWFQQALDGDLIEPNAMTLATASSDGKRSSLKRAILSPVLSTNLILP